MLWRILKITYPSAVSASLKVALTSKKVLHRAAAVIAIHAAISLAAFR
jgi:hypothetical protein